MVPLILFALLALVGAAFFTLGELTVFSLADSRVRTLVEEGFQGAAALRALREKPERLLVLLRAGAAGSGALAGATLGLIGYRVGGPGGLVVGFLGAALLLLLAGHLLPMGLAVRGNVRIALAFAPLLLPVVRNLRGSLGLLERWVRGSPERPVPTLAVAPEEEVRQLTEIGHSEGVIEPEERQLVERVFRLDETRARDIMTPRVDIFAWRDSLSLLEIAQELQTVPYSRVPVFGESIDDITGVLYIRDAYQALVSGQRDVPLHELAREPLIVPGSIPLNPLLNDFQSRRIHLAVVVDEYGGTDGLVTLEDILEELVGEIVDETDVAEEAVVRINRHELLAAGDADLREINHFFNTAFPLLEHRSLNGYLLEELGRVPQAGERLVREGVEIEILEATEAQVLRARLERITSPARGGEERTGERREAEDDGTGSPDRREDADR